MAIQAQMMESKGFLDTLSGYIPSIQDVKDGATGLSNWWDNTSALSMEIDPKTGLKLSSPMMEDVGVLMRGVGDALAEPYADPRGYAEREIADRSREGNRDFSMVGPGLQEALIAKLRGEDAGPAMQQVYEGGLEGIGNYAMSGLSAAEYLPFIGAGLGTIRKGVNVAGDMARAANKGDELVDAIAKSKMGHNGGPPLMANKGSPFNIKTAKDEAKAVDDYLALAEDGADFRNWYDESGSSNMFHMGDNPIQAARFTGAQARTSASTAVDANLGHAIKGHNQKMAGQQAKTGQYPTAMGASIDNYYAAPDASKVFDEIGLKIGPYAENIAKGGGYAGTNMNRSVHDIWDGRNWGYQNLDGSAWDEGFSPTQHRWMDNQMDIAVEKANRIKLGGFDNWDERSLQAATWISGKAKHEGTSIAQAGRNYSDLMNKYYGQGSYESVAGKTTDHLQGMLSQPLDVRQEYMDDIASLLTDAKGRDELSLAFGLPTGKSFSAAGVFEGGVNPSVQTQVALGRATGGKSIDPASAAIMDAVESTRGLLLGQDAAAFHLGGNAGEALKRTGVLEYNLGRTVTDDEMIDIIGKIKSQYGEDALKYISPIGSPNGFKLLHFGGNGTVFAKGGRNISKSLGIGEPIRKPLIGGNLIENNWKQNPLGQKYIEHINSPQFEAAFDISAPKIAQKLIKIDSNIKGLGAVEKTEVTKVRNIVANEGIQGLKRAIAKNAVSVGAVGLVIGLMYQGQDFQQQEY
jgi:hypothetical protein